MEFVELRARMSEAVIEILAVDPRIPEAVELIHALSGELPERYEYAADGSGNFRQEDALVDRSVFVIGRTGTVRSHAARYARCRRRR